MTQPASPAQIRKIHTLARQAGLNEETRRDVIAGVARGKRSSKELDIREAIAVIDRLDRLASDLGAARMRAATRGAMKLDGPYVDKVRALWISGWHLGVVRDRTDKAMCAFIERQTGLAHANWLREAGQARRVIEALKKWLERDGGVDWKGEEADSAGAKRAVYLAIRRALTAEGVDPHFNEFPGRSFAPNDGAALEQLTRAAGDRLRRTRSEGAADLTRPARGAGGA